MRKKLLGIIMGVMMLVGALAPQMAFATTCEESLGTKKFFGLDPWYAHLTCDGKEIAQSNFEKDQLAGTILSIIGVVVEDLLFVGGFLAVGFLIYAGIQYATSAGDPSKASKASKTISASIVGLIISILGYAIIKLIFELATGE